MGKILLLGSDPELFTIDRSTGKLSSVAGKLGCDKWNKRTYSADVRIQEDNVLVEFDTNPQGSMEAFMKNLSDGLKACEEVVNEVNHDIAPNISSHIYSMDELKSFHKSVFTFGCEPDYNALTGMVNPKPTSVDPGLRSAGGHVHFGYRDLLPKGMDFSQSQAIVGVMADYYLGLYSVLEDMDNRRRELYGKAGSIRMKDYGIEYRSLSNFWIFKEETKKMIWQQANKVVASLEGEWERISAMVDPQEIQRVINEGDRRAAERYISTLGIL